MSRAMKAAGIGLLGLAMVGPAGCGGGGDLTEGIPEGAFEKAVPVEDRLTDAQKEMKKKMEKQKGPAPAAPKGMTDAQKKMLEKMQKGQQ